MQLFYFLLAIPVILVIGVIYWAPFVLNAVVTLLLGIVLAVVVCSIVYFLLRFLLPKKIPRGISLATGLVIGLLICHVIFLWITDGVPKWSEKPESTDVEKSIVGMTYDDFSDGRTNVIVHEGDVFERCVLTIIDTHTLEYKIGNFKYSHVNGYDDFGDWIEEEILETGTSPYEISYNYITGKTILKYNTLTQKMKCELRFEARPTHEKRKGPQREKHHHKNNDAFFAQHSF